MYRAPADLRTRISEESPDDHVDIIAADRGTAGTISAQAIRTLTTAGQVVLSCGVAGDHVISAIATGELHGHYGSAGIRQKRAAADA